MGARGILLVSDKEQYLASPPEVNVVNTIGAGDSAVAGFVYGIVSGKRLDESLVYAVAAGTATTLRPGSALCTKDDFLKLVPQVRLYEKDEMKNILEAVRQYPDVKDIFILNRTGRIVTSINGQEMGKTIDIRDPTCQVCHQGTTRALNKTVIYSSFQNVAEAGHGVADLRSFNLGSVSLINQMHSAPQIKAKFKRFG
jgi:hypothetical protein